jgi:cyclic pyranopterin phosphate synthase
MPTTPFEDFKEEVVSFKELFRFVKVAIDNGVKKIRLTGGEPTLRAGLDEFIKNIFEYDSSVDIALTTNGYLLKEQAKKLKDAGLKRINISLDSLKKDRAQKIAQKDVLDAVLSGIDEALKVGLGVKANMVPIKGVNDDEVVEILEYCLQKGVAIRFIEYMENQMASSEIQGLRGEEILEIISKKLNFREKEKDFFGPARLFELENGGMFGIISPHAHDFCDSCNRIRVSANGDLIPCLYFDEALSAKDAMQRGDDKEIEKLLKQVVKDKPEKNRWSVGESSARAFYKTGG